MGQTGESRCAVALMTDHRHTRMWLGERVETLEDLLRPNLRAVVIGINPSCVSVEAGHYYQGRLGQLLFRRLRAVGLFEGAPRGEEDDALLARGVGFTDVVKRPSRRANELSARDLAHGRRVLERKLTSLDAPLLIFTYKRAATALYGPFDGAGFISRSGERPARFVMPGPYASRAVADELLADLREHLRGGPEAGAQLSR